MEIFYKPSFLRDFKKLPPELQSDGLEKIELFKDTKNHKKLRVHKLKGRLSDFHSFSVSYTHRIVFQYEDSNTAVFLGIGNHDIYK